MGVARLEQGLNEVKIVLFEDGVVVIALVHEVLEFLFQVVEVDRVLVDMLEEVLACSLPVGVELNLAVGVVKIELSVEGMVVQRRVEVLLARVRQSCFQNFSNPSRTTSTSLGVPSSSNRYI